jgi:hypothetical protein
MSKNTHELNLEHSIAIVGNNIFLRCGQQRGKMFSIVGNIAEESPQRRTVKHFFVSLFLYLKRQFA